MDFSVIIPAHNEEKYIKWIHCCRQIIITRICHIEESRHILPIRERRLKND